MQKGVGISSIANEWKLMSWEEVERRLLLAFAIQGLRSLTVNFVQYSLPTTNLLMVSILCDAFLPIILCFHSLSASRVGFANFDLQYVYVIVWLYGRRVDYLILPLPSNKNLRSTYSTFNVESYYFHAELDKLLQFSL